MAERANVEVTYMDSDLQESQPTDETPQDESHMRVMTKQELIDQAKAEVQQLQE
jgi:hypothetical protein